MPRAVFEPTVPASKRLQTHALNRSAFGFGSWRLVYLPSTVHLKHILLVVWTACFYVRKHVDRFRRVSLLAESTSWLCHVRLSVYPYVSEQLSLLRFPWNFILTSMKNCQENQNMFKIVQKYRAVCIEVQYVVLLPVTLNHHKWMNEWNGIGLLPYPRRCIKYANTPQYYGIRALPTCCFSLFVQSAVGLKSVRSVVNIASLNESDRGMKILYYRTFVRNVCVITSPQERVTLYIRSLMHLFCSNISVKRRFIDVNMICYYFWIHSSWQIQDCYTRPSPIGKCVLSEDDKY